MTPQQVLDIIHANPEPIYHLLEVSKDKKGFVCPVCGHGRNGDGIAFETKPGKNQGRWHCFSCDRSGDAVELYGIIKGREGNNHFTENLKELARIYGVSIDPQQKQPAAPAAKPTQATTAAAPTTEQPKQPAAETPSNAINENDLIAQDIAEAQEQKNLEERDYADYIARRGLSYTLARRFNIGYLPEWTHPKYRAAGDNSKTPTPRLIIPTGDHSYLARDTREDIPEWQNKTKKMKAGKTQIFNFDAIAKATRPVFVVEGAIDAISFYAIEAVAIGLGSTTAVQQFVDQLKQAKYSKKPTFVIALDNDEAGARAIRKLADELDKLKFSYEVCNVSGDYKDPNEALIYDPAGFEARVRAAERFEISRDTNAAYLDKLRTAFEKTPQPIPTGFDQLDDLLDGGLMSGLYFIGGVSSSGKTAICMQVIDQVAQSGGSSLVFAAEMSRADLIARSISRETVLAGGDNQFLYFTQREVQAGYKFEQYSPSRLANLDAAYKSYAKYAGRVTIYENTGDSMKPSAIRDRIARYCGVSGERPVVLIDYLQILTPENDRQDIRNCIDDTIRALKSIATEFTLPILVVSSLNRDNYTAPLNFAAFKESGNIEYGADYLFGLQFTCVHDNEFSQKGAEKAFLLNRLAEEKKKPIREVEITILKQRGGRSSGAVKLNYDARHNLYRQAQEVEDYLTDNFSDSDEQRYHRQRMTGHSVSSQYNPLVYANATAAKQIKDI